MCVCLSVSYCVEAFVSAVLMFSLLLFHTLSDELLSSQEKTSGVKDVIVSIDTSKDSDADSSKPSSKATSLQNSPAIQKGRHQLVHIRINHCLAFRIFSPEISFTLFSEIQLIHQ